MVNETRRKRGTILSLLCAATLPALVACGADSNTLGSPGGGGGTNNGGEEGSGGTGSGSGSGTSDGSGSSADISTNPNMTTRVTDYGEALRTASLKLVGELPTLAQVKAVDGAQGDAAKKALYEGEVDKMLADPRFATRMVQWWRDTFKTGAPGVTAAQGAPNMDTAAVYAAQLVVQDRSYMELFTGTTGLCPTFTNGTFTAAECAATTPKAGVLGNPALMAQYFANMAFRRVRFVQETFACTKYPAEYSKSPTPMGASLYTSPWDFNSIAGGTGSRIDFKDTSSVICANCHTTMNHLAPLFANFNAQGVFNPTTIQVETPIVSNVAAEKVTRLTDWLPAGQVTSWRNGQAVADLPALGAAMAKDPDVARCAITRAWNFAMSRGDVVADLSTVPEVVTEPYLAGFQSSGFKWKKVLRDIFTSEDFTKF